MQAGLQLSPALDANRRTLYILSLILMPAGLCSLICCWAVYYFGAVLSFGAMATGFLQFSHSKSPEALLGSSFVVAARTAFNTLQMMNIAGVLLAFISFCCNAYALYYYATWAWFLGYAYVAFAVIGLLACLSILIAAAFGAMKCGEVNRELQMIIPAPVAAVAVAAATGAYVAMTSPVMAGRPAYAQPGYPQPGYGQPAPGYGQPAPGYGHPGGYAQPYGQPYAKPV